MIGNSNTVSIRIDVDAQQGIRVMQQVSAETKMMANEGAAAISAASAKNTKTLEEFSNKHQKLLLNDTEFAKRTLAQEVEKYRSAGADKGAVDDYHRRSLKDIEAQAAKTGGSLTGMYKAAIALGATAALVSGLRSAVAAASDLGESQNKVNVIYGAAGSIIEDWARTSAAAFGLSRQAAYDAAGTMGNMWRQLGAGTDAAAANSMAMIGLASDLASFHNAAGGTNEVLAAMQSAFRGEYDALQRYIPTINAAAVEQEALAETGKKSAKELTALEKATAAQAIIMQNAGAAVGDFARTSDGLANATRILDSQVGNLSANIGGLMMPAMTEAITVMGFWAEAAGKLFDKLNPTWLDHTKAQMAELSEAIAAESAKLSEDTRPWLLNLTWTDAHQAATIARIEVLKKQYALLEQTVRNEAGGTAAVVVETDQKRVASATLTAKETKKAVADFSKFQREATLNDYEFAVSQLDLEVEKFREAGISKEEITEAYTAKLGALQNKYLNVVDGSNNAIYESELAKWSRIDQASMAGAAEAIKRHQAMAAEAKSTAAEQAQAYAKLYQDIGQTSEQSYQYKVGLLDKEYAQLAKVLGDSELLQEAYARRRQELDWEIALATGDFLDGMTVAWEQHEEKKKTLAEHGKDIFLGVHQEMRSGFRSVFYDALTDDLGTLEDYARGVWQGIAASFAQMAADMVTEYAVSGLQGLLTGEGGGSLVSGIVGAAGGIVDFASDLFSELDLWHTGAWMINQDQVAKLQAGEMVIPSDMAGAVRDLIEASGGGVGMAEGLASATGYGSLSQAAAAGLLEGGLSGMLQGAGVTGLQGIAAGASIGDILGAAAGKGFAGLTSGLLGAGTLAALGLDSKTADIGKMAGAMLGSVLGLGPMSTALGIIGALVSEGLFGTTSVWSTTLTPSQLMSGAWGPATYHHDAEVDLQNPQSVRGGVGYSGSMYGYGGYGDLGIGNPGSYGGNDGSVGGGGMGGGRGEGAGDVGADSSAGGGGMGGVRYGGWTTGPDSGYEVVHHGTELTLNSREVDVVRSLMSGGHRQQPMTVIVQVGNQEFEAVIREQADIVRVEANRRGNVGTTRIYT